LDEEVGVLKRLKVEGKIRAIGVSNFSIDQLKEAEKELLPYTSEQNISFVPYFPLASGLLAGKYNKDAVLNDLRTKKPHFPEDAFTQNLEKVEQVPRLNMWMLPILFSLCI
jgi:myo-inositol catabolism protein IolS